MLLTWYDYDVWLVAYPLVPVEFRDHHDPVLGHGHGLRDLRDDDSLRSCLGHSLAPWCPLTLSTGQPGLSEVGTLCLSLHSTPLYTLNTLYTFSPCINKAFIWTNKSNYHCHCRATARIYCCHIVAFLSWEKASALKRFRIHFITFCIQIQHINTFKNHFNHIFLLLNITEFWRVSV